MAAFPIERVRLQRDALSVQIVDFFNIARKMVAVPSPSAEENGRETFKQKSNAADQNANDEMLSRITSLTPRQKLVLTVLAEGKPNKLIAYELNIRNSTVKAHVSAILRKLKMHCRAQAVAQLARIGIDSINSKAAGDDAAKKLS